MSEKIIFVYPYRMTEGGMPEDIRMFISAVQKEYKGTIALLTQGAPADPGGLLTEVMLADIESGESEIGRLLQSLTKDAITVFITFSNLFNVRLAHRLRKREMRYCVLPAWQVNDFLDWDRPFAKNAIPTVKASENNPGKFVAPAQSGVVEGRRTMRGAVRAIKRRIFRKTLGRSFLSHASGILTFSEFEKAEIERLVKPTQPTYLDVCFGTQQSTRPVGPDTFHNAGKKNIVFWGRADYYYKGLDIILEAIYQAKLKGISVPFTFWIIGPDYNRGYMKVQNHANRLAVDDVVRILKPGDYTPGTDGFLRQADFCIMASRWDGHSRTLRETSALGVPFISNRQTHFDTVAKRFGNGLIYDDALDLAHILANLSAPSVVEVVKNAKANASTLAEFLSWNSVAKDFINSLTISNINYR